MSLVAENPGPLKEVISDMTNLRAQAKEFQDNADWAQARQLWEELHETAPAKADLQSWTGLARCCFNLQDLAAASQAARQALEIKARHLPAMIISAKIASVQEDWPRAAQLWRTVSEATPKPAVRVNAQTRLARALIELGEFEEVEALLHGQMSDTPDKPAPWELLAKTAEKRKNTSVARERWSAFQARFPAEAAASSAYLKFAGGEAAEDIAQFSLEDLRNADEDSAQRILSYLSARLTKGEYAETVRQLAERFPDSPGFEVNFLTVRTGNISSPQELEETLERAAAFSRRFPAHPRGWRLQANAHVAANDPDAVRRLTAEVERTGGRSHATTVLNAWVAQSEGDQSRAAELSAQARATRYNRAEDLRGLDLRPLNPEPLHSFRDNILLFASFQNERAFVPWFLNYYRSIGVEWFFIIDNQSQDGTAEFLAAQKDVTVYSSADVFLSVASGMCWINALIQRYGDGNWCLFIDADEQLVVPGVEEHGLRPFLDGMTERGEEALPGFMLDTYPESMAAAAEFRPGDDALAVSRLIDPEHYFTGTADCCYFRARGGVRSRLFGTREVLEKTPVLRGGGERLYKDNHYISHARVSSQSAVLLHHKILRDALDAAQSSGDLASRIQERRALCRVRHAKYRSAGYYGSESLPKGLGVFEYQDSAQLLQHGLLGGMSRLTQSDASATEARYTRIDG